jgi:hypothetical protein
MLPARQVIIAAGTVGTTELLLRCRDFHRPLPQLGSVLGSHFSGNGDFLLAATFEANRHVDPGAGPSITAGPTLTISGLAERVAFRIIHERKIASNDGQAPINL